MLQAVGHVSAASWLLQGTMPMGMARYLHDVAQHFGCLCVQLATFRLRSCELIVFERLFWHMAAPTLEDYLKTVEEGTRDRCDLWIASVCSDLCRGAWQDACWRVQDPQGK